MDALLPADHRTAEAATVPTDPARLPPIVTRGDALAAGLTPDQGRQRVRSGRRRRLDTGVYLRTARCGTGVGIPVTTVARTVLDVARLRDLSDGLAVADAALRSGRVRGCRVSETVLSQMDGRRETALESLSWSGFLQWRLPLPVMQQEFRDEHGLAGCVDFWWQERRLVGEADGRLTYATADDPYAEKRREGRLRALGLQVVRWGWSDLWGAAGERLRQRSLALPR